MKLAASNLAWDIKDDNKIIDKLKELNILEINPIQALNILDELIKEIDNNML